tara:strand:+ start:97 stop:873 length:777 start_codon:yes stop_codon:yes gene_type:complete
MLLRSITKHVKDQNWFAVALDFVIVVFGVYIGIQLGNWNEERVDQARSQQYMKWMANDLTQEISIYNDRVQFWQQVSEYGLAVLDEANTGETSLSSWELIIAYFQASQSAEFFPSNATFEELQSAGDLELVRNADLRNALSEYYAYPGVENLRERPRYREHIRSLLPARIQKYIWLNCYGTDGALQVLKACPSPITQTESEAIIDRLKSNETLLDELRYWISSLQIAGLIASGNAQLAKELRDELYEQLDSHVEKRPL